MKNFKIVWHRSDVGTYERVVKTRSLGQCVACALKIFELMDEVLSFEVYKQGSLGAGMWFKVYERKR